MSPGKVPGDINFIKVLIFCRFELAHFRLQNDKVIFQTMVCKSAIHYPKYFFSVFVCYQEYIGIVSHLYSQLA